MSKYTNAQPQELADIHECNALAYGRNGADGAAHLAIKTAATLRALQAFKEYVHKRLDEAGIPTHPDGPHSAAGCRIGDRLDIVLSAAPCKPPREPA